MSKVQVIAYQSLLDIALQEGGDVRYAFDLALENDLSIPGELEVAQELNLPSSELKNGDILNYYKNRSIRPATYQVLETENEMNYQFPIIFPII